MSFQRSCLKLAVVVVVGVLALGAQSASASAISVTTGADSGPGSLRAAIAAANPGDTVSIPALTVTLTSGQLVINQNLTITGAGARLTTITGSNLSRVFDITAGTVAISGVTITGGNGMDTPGGTAGSGGGILSSGTLTLTDSTITGNQTQGSNEGAGIQNDATLTVIRSTISSNSALGSDRAGGIGDSGPLAVIDSTIAHNTIQTGGLGAGIYVNNAGTGGVTFTNDTFDLNAAGPTGSNIDLNYESRPTAIANTIILGGSTGSCSRMPAASPSVGGNVDDQSSCEFTQATDHHNATLALGALQDNGGATDTQLPTSGSVAIDGASDAYCPTTDQRGVPRPQGPHCDIGSVERTTPGTGAPSVSGVTTTGATLTTTVNTAYIGGTYTYSYGPTTAYGASTPTQTLAGGSGSQSAVASLSGLSPSTTYHVKLNLTTPDGAASSSDVTFTTATVAVAPTPPVLTNVSQAARRWKAGRALPHITRKAKIPTGTTFKFTLNESARVTLSFTRGVSGRRVGVRCLKLTKKNRHRPKCTFQAPRGSLTFNGHAGVNSVAFEGRISKHVKLTPGTYTLTITALNSAQQVATPKVLVFTIVKA